MRDALTPDEMTRLLYRSTRGVGGTKSLAASIGTSRQCICRQRNGQTPVSDFVAHALGYQRKTVYTLIDASAAPKS